MIPKKTITAHCLVKNEARFIWYSVMSIYDSVDKILLYDTGSTDGTIEIINEILKADKEDKVSFREYEGIDATNFWNVRQDMLDQTKTDWFIVVDGDEIWWDDSIKRLVLEVSARGEKIETVVVPTINLVGDIFHYLEPQAGKYKFGKLKGHYNLRAVNTNIPGLHSQGEHGVWGWVDKDSKMIQDRVENKLLFVDAPYLHATFINRASERSQEFAVAKRAKKLKFETGIEFPFDFYYPEVFFRPRPSIVPSVWQKMSLKYKVRALFETPLRKIKRRLFVSKVGY